jgi:hypothetical protein
LSLIVFISEKKTWITKGTQEKKNQRHSISGYKLRPLLGFYYRLQSKGLLGVNEWHWTLYCWINKKKERLVNKKQTHRWTKSATVGVS